MFQNYQRINLFLKLMSIIDNEPNEFDGSDLQFYLSCLVNMDEKNKRNPACALAMNCQPRNMVTLKCGLDFIINMITKDNLMNAAIDLDDAL
jgi:hypothetical protein